MNFEKLRHTMRKKGWSSDKLAQQIGVESEAMRRKIYGFEKITIGEAIRITAALDLSNDEASLIILDF